MSEGIILARPLGGASETTKIVQGVTTEQIIDSVKVDGIAAVRWLVFTQASADLNKKKFVEITAIHNGTGSDATDAQYSIISTLKYGSISGLSFSVGLSGIGLSQNMELKVSSIDSVDVHITRSLVSLL